MKQYFTASAATCCAAALNHEQLAFINCRISWDCLRRAITAVLAQVGTINLLCKEAAMLQHAFQTSVSGLYRSSTHVTTRSTSRGCRMLTGCSCCPGKTTCLKQHRDLLLCKILKAVLFRQVVHGAAYMHPWGLNHTFLSLWEVKDILEACKVTQNRALYTRFVLSARSTPSQIDRNSAAGGI